MAKHNRKPGVVGCGFRKVGAAGQIGKLSGLLLLVLGFGLHFNVRFCTVLLGAWVVSHSPSFSPHPSLACLFASRPSSALSLRALPQPRALLRSATRSGGFYSIGSRTTATERVVGGGEEEKSLKRQSSFSLASRPAGLSLLSLPLLKKSGRSFSTSQSKGTSNLMGACLSAPFF